MASRSCTDSHRREGIAGRSDRPRRITQPGSSGLDESTDGRVETPNGEHTSTVMVRYHVVEKGECLGDQYKRNDRHTDAVNECHGEFWTLLVNKARESDLFEAAQAMDEGEENRFINEKERGVLPDVDLGRIAPRFFLQLDRARKAVLAELSGLLHIRHGSSALELVRASDPQWGNNERLRIMIVLKKKPMPNLKRDLR